MKYTPDDQNYVTKYTKIDFEDDAAAQRLKSSEYAKKYEDIMVKIILKFKSEEKRKSLHFFPD